jgi:hypothetical protein
VLALSTQSGELVEPYEQKELERLRAQDQKEI